ncbi:MAG: hypothetical protein M1147_02335 [Nitrospirae bacterium]|nr:hypothetical protein [Nitrospirota bacterium]MCL5976951.1 hypothetical protein [Nitrospirota bacterium]
MRNSWLKPILIIAAVFVAASVVCGPVWSEEAVSKKKKKYPHPHALHLEAMSQTTADISMDEIKDWPGLMRSIKGKIDILPLSVEARMIMGSFRPDALNSDEKAVVAGEMNKLLSDEKFGSYVKSTVALSAATMKLESDYMKSKDTEDLKWMNRSIVSDMFTQIPRKEKVRGLKQITCATCHEAWGPKAWGQVGKGDAYNAAVINERAVTECFSKVIAGEKGMEECAEMINIIKRSRIQDPGPLAKFIQRKNEKGEIEFFAAVHPEDPYTFKPLLKRLVCVECHGQERKVTKFRGRDGKVKDIPIFYGLGIKKRHEHEHESER